MTELIPLTVPNLYPHTLRISVFGHGRIGLYSEMVCHSENLFSRAVIFPDQKVVQLGTHEGVSGLPFGRILVPRRHIISSERVKVIMVRVISKSICLTDCR
jgi:hypothetical protein